MSPSYQFIPPANPGSPTTRNLKLNLRNATTYIRDPTHFSLNAITDTNQSDNSRSHIPHQSPSTTYAKICSKTPTRPRIASRECQNGNVKAAIDCNSEPAFSRHFSRRQETVGVAASGLTRKRSAADGGENDVQTAQSKGLEGKGMRGGEIEREKKSLSMNSWRASAWAYLRDRIDCLRAVACVYPAHRGYFHVRRRVQRLEIPISAR